MTPDTGRRSQRAVTFAVAVAATLALPLVAEQTAPWEAAIARLDFPAALDTLGDAIAADPAAPAPRLARAGLHLKMHRPALALADLDAVLDADPAHVPALLARAEIWDSQRAWNRAREDLDAAVAAGPDDPVALAARARVNERAGLAAAALDDIDAALALTPEDPALVAARARLTAAQESRRAAEIVFDPAAVMDEDYLVTEGDAAAPNTLHFVHAAPELAGDYAGLDRAALDRAARGGALRIVHLFTYAGSDASVWGNLALICAGSEGFTDTHAALAGPEGQAALTAVDNGAFAALEDLLAEAYAAAGLDPGLVQSCARDRLGATRYLADWQEHQAAGAWRGVNLLDTWPAWVWNGTPVGPQALNARLTEIAPAPDMGMADGDAGLEGAAPDVPVLPADQPGAGEPEGPEDITSAAAPPAPAQPGDDARADRQADPAIPIPEGPLFPTRPEPAGDVRVPVALRGVYAPDLAACLGYLEAIESPDRIDAVLPEMNPLDGPALGTILVTSRRVYLFNPLDTECAIAGAGSGAEAGWSGAFSCASPLAPDTGTSLQLTPAEADGTAPRITARFGTGAPAVLRQCRALGQLGQAFAPLWTRDGRACTASVPVAPGRFTFSVDGGGILVLRVAPVTIPNEAGRSTLHAVVDGTALSDTTGRWDGTGWQMPLGAIRRGRGATQLGDVSRRPRVRRRFRGPPAPVREQRRDGRPRRLRLRRVNPTPVIPPRPTTSSSGRSVAACVTAPDHSAAALSPAARSTSV
jgi:tetratricopeptide (TPR) repeat protein